MFQKIKFYDGQKPEGWLPFLKELSKDNAKGILLFVGEENSLLVAGEMPENFVLVVTKGYPDKLIAAAGTAVEQAKIASTGDKYIELYNKTIVIGMEE